MRSRHRVLAAAILTLLWPQFSGQPCARAADKPANPRNKDPAMLIEPMELRGRLKDAELTILDTRAEDDYAAGHIPGAVRVDVAGWQAIGKSEGGFQNAESWGDAVGRLGINLETPVVVYGSRLPDTARVWWLLKYVGVREVMLLDGGWEGWVDGGGPTETQVPRVTPIRFEPNFQADRLEEIDTLKESVAAGKAKVVDTRSGAEFDGSEVRGKRGGHIPGATHLEWTELLADDGRFKTPAQLKELFLARGILPEESPICY